MIQKIVLLIIKFFDQLHNKKIINFLKKKKFDKFEIFLDVGAHKGETISLFLRSFDISKIISFEASPINFKFLKNNENKLKNKFNKSKIIIENIALGKEKKIEKFKQFIETSSSTISDIDQESKYFKKKYKYLNLFNSQKLFKVYDIQIHTLYDYLTQNKLKKVDFLKIDTEGFEFEILKGLKKNISEVNLIMFEHHYDNMLKKKYKFKDIHNLLVSNNFKMFFKAKMPFRKTFEYIYINGKSLN